MKFFEPSEYQPTAIAVFEQIKAEILLTLPFAQIEHIGSSAIKGSISKGDLDIFVGVSKEQFSKSLEDIGRLGFKIKVDTYRSDSLCMLETAKFNLDVAIQLVELGSQYEGFFLDFRDCMNADPQLVEKYNQLKDQSRGLAPDEYRLKKSKFISEVLKET